MSRILSILAFVIAVAVVGAAIYELNDRSSDDDGLALPTTPPSPTELPSPIDTPTDAPAATAPAPSDTPEPDKTEPATATSTPAPPRTPTPEPATTAAPIDTGEGSTPRTGDDSWPAGVALALAALALRGVLLRRHSS